MRKFTLLVATLLCMNTANIAFSRPLEGLKGRFSFGYSSNTGNTSESKLDFSYDLSQKRTEKLKYHYEGLYLRGKADNVKNADKQQLGFLSEFIQNKKESWYGSLGYLRDEFAGYEKQWKLGLGYIRYLINDDLTNLSCSLGCDFIEESLTDNTSNSQRWLRLGLKGKREIQENVHTNAAVSVSLPQHHWKDSYRTSAQVGLIFVVNKQLDVEVKYLHEFNKGPVDNKRKNDTTFMTSISYKL